MPDVNLPPEIETQLNEAARSTYRPTDAKKVFIAIPNMCQINTGLVAKLFAFAMQREYDPWFHFMTEKRHHDYARNAVTKIFLSSKCDYMLMIDSDVDPHPETLKLVEERKDIIAGNVFCWINGELMPSIWQLAECEQCRCLKIWQDEGKINDESQYVEKLGMLWRWNPFSQNYNEFAYKTGIKEDLKCRCKGTGMDPWVYRTHQTLKPEVMQVDSVGAACMLVHRSVFEKMPQPWFQFLYRPTREILLTEDHFFCWKAQECGFTVWADPRKLCSHFKLVDILQIQGPIAKAYELGKKRTLAEIEKAHESVVIPVEEKIASV